MVQATTPTFVLTLPNTVDLTEAERVIFTLIQKPNVITKEGADLEITAHTVSVYLTQSDTVGFIEGTAKIQLNWLYPNGTRACSNIVTVPVSPNLLPEVIS